MFFDPDGSELDWIVGYGPPAEDFQKKIDKVLAGIDTYKSLAAKFAADPQNVETRLQAGREMGRPLRPGQSGRPLQAGHRPRSRTGQKGTTEYGRDKVKVSYTQMAEFNIASSAMSARPPDVAPFLAFVKKYPDSQIVKDAYARVSSFYGRQGAKEDATKFFEDYTKRFSGEAMAYSGWVTRIIFDKEPLDKGIELAQKAISLSQGRAAMSGWQNLGRLYVLKGDKAKAIDAADQMMKGRRRCRRRRPARFAAVPDGRRSRRRSSRSRPDLPRRRRAREGPRGLRPRLREPRTRRAARC